MQQNLCSIYPREVHTYSRIPSVSVFFLVLSSFTFNDSLTSVFSSKSSIYFLFSVNYDAFCTRSPNTIMLTFRWYSTMRRNVPGSLNSNCFLSENLMTRQMCFRFISFVFLILADNKLFIVIGWCGINPLPFLSHLSACSCNNRTKTWKPSIVATPLVVEFVFSGKANLRNGFYIFIRTIYACFAQKIFGCCKNSVFRYCFCFFAVSQAGLVSPTYANNTDFGNPFHLRIEQNYRHKFENFKWPYRTTSQSHQALLMTWSVVFVAWKNSPDIRSLNFTKKSCQTCKF